MKVSQNRIKERSGVNALTTLLERSGLIVQEVSGGNDYGKDAYVDLSKDGEITGVCVALQIKSGASYRRAEGYAVPVGNHERVWRDSTVPIAGIVHDERDDGLYWCDISSKLAESDSKTLKSIAVQRDDRLDVNEGVANFCNHFTSIGNALAVQRAVPQLTSESERAQMVALYDCFAMGRKRPEIFKCMRYLMPAYKMENLRLSIWLLSHATPHPDVLWTRENVVDTNVETALRPHLKWSDAEAERMLRAVPWEEWHRGGLGESLFMLLREDPKRIRLMKSVLDSSLKCGEDEVAFSAFYLALYWSKEDAKRQFKELTETHPRLLHIDLVKEVEVMLRHAKEVPLFS